jgi:SOS-response transcriptional repressor LexA
MHGYYDLFNSLTWPPDDTRERPPTPASYEVALKATYAWIQAFIADQGQPPTIFEIHRALGLRYGVARLRVEAMERRGWIYRDEDGPVIELKGIGGKE